MIITLEQLRESLLAVKNYITNILPTKVSDLDNDINFVSDANYVHTDNNYTSAEKIKLTGIENNAQKNVI